MKIFVTGQCTLHWGRLEFGNIGNYYITETTFRELHRVFPEATISTTFQMTKEFCDREKITVVPMELFYNWDENDLPLALEELGIAEIYNKTGKLIKTTPFIEEILASDLIVDFSGEMWGYHADLVGKNRFLVGLIKDRVAQLFKKPTVMLAGTQGGFPDPQIKKFAKEVFENFSFVANREAETEKLLVKEGFETKNLKNYACPSFLFEAYNDITMKPIYDREGLSNTDKPKVGFVLCGFNFTEGPYDKWPRKDEDYNQFVEVIEYVINKIGADVYLMSHSNGFDLPPNFKLKPGRDYPIVEQLRDILNKRGKVSEKSIKLIRGPYSPKETKAIIRKFDMFISGRLHAAVAATSQSIPTVVIMHGHGQKSHKTIGFFDILNLSEYVAYPDSSKNMIEKVEKCWSNKIMIKKHLNKRIPEVQLIVKKVLKN